MNEVRRLLAARSIRLRPLPSALQMYKKVKYADGRVVTMYQNDPPLTGEHVAAAWPAIRRARREQKVREGNNQ